MDWQALEAKVDELARSGAFDQPEHRLVRPIDIDDGVGPPWTEQQWLEESYR